MIGSAFETTVLVFKSKALNMDCGWSPSESVLAVQLHAVM